MIRKGIVFLMFISTQDVDEGAAHVLLISHAETFTLPQPNIDLQEWWLGNYFPLWEGLFSGAVLVLERLLLLETLASSFQSFHFRYLADVATVPLAVKYHQFARLFEGNVY